MNKLLRFVFYRGLVRSIIMVVLGLNIRNIDRIPKNGPMILVANHNSHLDTMVLTTLLGRKNLNKVRPVAAMDYFLSNPLMAWFATKIIGILPIKRQRGTDGIDPLQPCYESLDRGEILIFFPEGTRGEPEQMVAFKKGITKLAQKYPDIPVVPVFMHGLGKSLPKGSFLLVPFFCDVFIGAPIYGHQVSKETYLNHLNQQILELAGEGNNLPWQ